MRRVLLSACIFALGAFTLAHAQISNAVFERELNLTLSPEYPAPGETVRLSIQTYALDLNRSNVVWYANDKEIARGAGLTEASVVAGESGFETRILVIAEDDEGITAGASAVIRPAEIDLLWEAESYAPPFYEGRVLPGTNSPIHAQAVARFKTPNGQTIADSDIVYTWYRNDAVAGAGRGKSSVTLPGPALFGSDTIRVAAVSVDETVSSEASTRISSVDPFITLYENHPLFGVLYHRSLEPGATTMETEQKVTAVPYFAGIRSPRDSQLAYEWSVNETRIEPDPREPQTLTITANGYRGPAAISLSLTSASDIFLRAVGEWRLVFGSESSIFSGLNPFDGNPFGE